ncbi:MAG TPA: pyridoxal-phosphate dependent enzyme [Bryobacteraceae bacterium]|nr:pyridoxal-phosphate dependent enzyme [Bryobacteraceae bacterium]
MHPRACLCGSCGADGDDPGVLDVHYDYAAARRDPFLSRQDLFRYLPLLPVDEPVMLLPAGATPLVSAPRLASQFGLAALYLKDETRNPTRCLKDRATAIGVTMAIQSGATDVYCASAGNAAISLAAFAAHAGLRCHVFVPSYASATRLDWLRRFGADVHVSAGNYDRAFAEAEQAGAAKGWYRRNCAFNPFLVEGKKTCALEIAETITPDFVVAPVGDGCTLGAIGKGFREARELGIIDRLPRLIGVQAAGVQPMVARFRGSQDQGNGETQAASIAVRRPRNALRLLGELKASGGEMVAVSDEQIARAQSALSEHAGIVAEFTSAATLAAIETLDVRDQSGVLVITGGRVD